jgi:oligopeptidase A
LVRFGKKVYPLFVEFPENPLDRGLERVSESIEKGRSKIAEIKNSSKRSYSDVITPLLDLDTELDEIFVPIYHINSVSNSDESQKVYSSILPVISEYGSEVGTDLELYKVIKEIPTEDLTIEQKKVVSNYIKSFKLSGAEVSDSEKERLKEISVRLSELSNSFSQNLLNATDSYKMLIEDFEDVRELPEIELKQAKVESGYQFSLKMPSYIAYMTYGSNRERREELYRAYTTRSPENSEIIDEILKLKREKAKILGFENFSELSIQKKMANSPDEVESFLNALASESKVQAKEEFQQIADFAEIDNLQSYDLAYYSEKYKKKYLSIDEEKYLPYFEQNRVVEGLFRFLGKLFKVEFQKTGEKLWHSSAKSYLIIEDGKVISKIYFDLEAREGKRGGAWVNDWLPHHIDGSGNQRLSQGFLACNFNPSSEDTPSLLKHDDVVTLFHEMGHLLHHSLSRVTQSSISGINGVEWDGVEFPSQFLENFAYERDVLQEFATHYQSGETLPDEMIQKLQDARNFQSAMSMVRQLEFGLFDFKLHRGEFSGDEVQNLLDSIRKELSPLQPPSYNRFQNGFSHIFAGGYSAGYYSYKWAEVLSADLFYAFIDSDFSSELTEKYRELILGMGGTFGMGELYRKLLDREPDVKSLLRLSGIGS